LPTDLTLMLGGAGQKGIAPTDIWGEGGRPGNGNVSKGSHPASLYI